MAKKAFDEDGWNSIRATALHYGITDSAVWQAARDGKIESKGSGRRRRVRGRCAGWTTTDILTPAEDEPTEPVKRGRPVSMTPDYNTSKAEKMAADAELSRLKVEKARTELAGYYCGILTDGIIKAFSGFKVRLVELNLSKAQLDSLRNDIDIALADLRQYVAKAIENNDEDTNDEADS